MSSDQENFYNRLSRTGTYASRTLRQRAEKPDDSESGRPLFNIVIEPKDSLHKHGEIRPLRSSSTVNTDFTSLSSRSGRYSQTSGSSSGVRRQSVFDRLANTGTKSSLRKHKMSATYVGEENTVAESIHKLQIKGYKNTHSMAQSSNRDKGVQIISFFPNQQEAEI